MVLGIALAATLTARGQVSAQELVMLRVRVTADAMAVVGARVQVARAEVATDAEGVAALQVVPGDHEVRVESAGFESWSGRVRAARDTLIVVQLEREVVEEEEILVLSTRGERRVEDEPVRVEVLTREEIEEKMLMTPGSIAMLLNETAGLRVQETAPSLGGASIRIQGLRGRYTQLLADGLPLYGGQAGALGPLQVPPMDLRQLEVIKGAASALYGASALGGVVNLISRRPDGAREMLVNGTTRGGIDVVAWLSGEADARLGATTLAGAHMQEHADVDDDGWRDIPQHRRGTLRQRLFWTSSSGAQMMWTGGAMVEDREGGGLTPDGVHRRDLATRRFDFGFTGRFPVMEALLLDVRGAGSRASHHHRFGARAESDRHETAFAEGSLRGDNGAHSWTVGVAVQRDVFEATHVTGFDYSYWVPSVFVQDEVRASPALGLAVSGRLDHHERYGTFLSPRVSARAHVPGGWTARLSAGAGFFAPVPFTEETEEIGLGRVAPRTDWRAERAGSFAADIGGRVLGVEINASAFASRIEDALALRPAPEPGQAELVNVPGTTRTRGTELLLRYRHEPWGLTVSHTFIDATEPHPVTGVRERVPLTPRHAAGLVAVYERHGEGRAGVEVYYTGRQVLDDNPFGDESDAYTIVGLLVEKRFGPLRAFLNLENLTDARQTRHQPVLRPAEGRYGEWTTPAWAPLEGRVFNGGARLSF